MERISASERAREELRAWIDGRLGTAASRSDLVRLAVRLIVEEALDAEATEAVGRERYARAAGAAAGYRTGYRTGKLRTAEGMVDYSAPQVRETPAPFSSAIRKAPAGRTEALEELAVELSARGLSTRDIEDAFTDESGRRLLSRPAVSEVTERLWEEYVTAIAATGFPGGVIGEGVAYGVGYVGTVALTKNPVTGATVATFCADAGKWAGRAGGVILGNEIKQIINSDNGNVVASHRNGPAPLMHILGTQNDGNGKAWTYGVDSNDQQVIWRTNQNRADGPMTVK